MGQPHNATRYLATVAIATSWLMLTAALFGGRAQIETVLNSFLGLRSRPDAFGHIDRIAPLFWVDHCAWCVFISAAIFRGWRNVVVVLLIGPIFALVINAVNESWSDPAWFTIVAICTIGWSVSLVVAAAYWLLRSVRLSRHIETEQNKN